MKRSTLTASALALAASLFAGSASAASVTAVYEQFSSDVFDGASHTNLTWSKLGDDNLSEVKDDKLSIDTGDNKVTAVIDSSVTNEIRKALAGNKSASFSAKVSFYPATGTHPDVGNDIKFALYAFAADNATNLYVQTVSTTNSVGPVTCGVETNVTVTFGINGAFTVDLGGSTRDGSFDGTISAIDFKGNGTVDDISIAYDKQYEATTEPVAISGDGNHTLTDTEAALLNAILEKDGMTVETINQKLANYNETEFAEASVLNLDITSESKPTYSFDIKGIKRNTLDSDKMDVTIVLTRSAVVADGTIRGTLKLLGATGPSANYKVINTADVDFDASAFTGTTATATATVDLGSNKTQYKFFKAEIEGNNN